MLVLPSSLHQPRIGINKFKDTSTKTAGDVRTAAVDRVTVTWKMDLCPAVVVHQVTSTEQVDK